jgi:hypothetical protein
LNSGFLEIVGDLKLKSRAVPKADADFTHNAGVIACCKNILDVSMLSASAFQRKDKKQRRGDYAAKVANP